MTVDIQEPRSHEINKNSKLQKFFINQLKDIYWAEKKLVKTLPKMSEAATTPDLKLAFDDHLLETKTHVTRLENIFELAGEEAQSLKCPAMVGILDECQDIIDETEKRTAQRDVGLIFASQKAEHYEIATYGGMIKLSEILGYNDITLLLKQTLQEEKNTDQRLSMIAEKDVNIRALNEINED